VPSTNGGPVDFDLKSPENNSTLTTIDPQCMDFYIIISSHEKSIADLVLDSDNEELMDDKYEQFSV
jgi:hypothetical protein